MNGISFWHNQRGSGCREGRLCGDHQLLFARQKLNGKWELSKKNFWVELSFNYRWNKIIVWTNSVPVHNTYSPSFPIFHCQHTWQLFDVFQHLSQFKSSVLGETWWDTARSYHPALLTNQMNLRLASFAVIMSQTISTWSTCDKQRCKKLLFGNEFSSRMIFIQPNSVILTYLHY